MLQCFIERLVNENIRIKDSQYQKFEEIVLFLDFKCKSDSVVKVCVDNCRLDLAEILMGLVKLNQLDLCD